MAKGGAGLGLKERDTPFAMFLFSFTYFFLQTAADDRMKSIKGDQVSHGEKGKEAWK